MAGVCLAAPFFASFDWTLGGATQPSWNTGFLIADRGDNAYKFHLEWCDSAFLAFSSASKAKCDDVVFVQLIMSIILFISFVLFIVTIVFIFCKPKVAFVLSPIAFTLAAASLFVFVLRFLPEMRDTVQAIDSTVSASWTYSWTGYIFFAFIVISFVGSVLLMICNKRIQKEREEVWREKEIAAAEKLAEEEKAKEQQGATTGDRQVVDPNQSVDNVGSPLNSTASGSPRIHHGQYVYEHRASSRESPSRQAPGARPTSQSNPSARSITPPPKPYGQ